MPKVYLIPCPLAPDTQFSHLCPEGQAAIKDAQVFFVEELKTARRFISSLKLGLVIEELVFEQVNKDTNQAQILAFVKKYAGKNIGVISEAGCPAIADPGSLVVEVGHKLGYQIIPVPGPSSVFLALMASGFNGQSFTFNGYLPIDQTPKITALKRLEALAQQGTTQIFMETPYRNNQFVKLMLEHLAPNTKLCIACNVTAPDQYIVSKTISEWKNDRNIIDLHKLPVIFLLK
jgi:16S rRNA (cytidine1402-2'-O)-methyltransferase